MRLDELHTESGCHGGSPLLVRFADAVGEGGDTALFEVLVHEGVHNGVVEAVKESDCLNDGYDHIKRDSVVFLLQVIWTITHRKKCHYSN